MPTPRQSEKDNDTASESKEKHNEININAKQCVNRHDVVNDEE